MAKGFVLAARQRPELRLMMLGGGSMGATLARDFATGGRDGQGAFCGAGVSDGVA